MPRVARSRSHPRRVVALLCLAALLAPQPALAGSKTTPLVWAQLPVLKPGDRLWVDDAAGRHVVHFVQASAGELLALELPAGIPDKHARRACRELARQPELAQLDLRGRGGLHELVDVARLARIYRQGDITSLAVVREGSGKKLLKVALGLVAAYVVLGLALLVAYHPT